MSPAKKTNITLWTIQILLAALFLFAGGFKLVIPADALAAQSHFPGAFMKFIGVAETLGGLGLILPGLTEIKVGLTPLAAIGLVLIMVGAVVTSVIQLGIGAAIVPFVVGALAAFVARRRWQLIHSFA